MDAFRQQDIRGGEKKLEQPEEGRVIIKGKGRSSFYLTGWKKTRSTLADSRAIRTTRVDSGWLLTDNHQHTTGYQPEIRTI